jgi:hypothetical protein
MRNGAWWRAWPRCRSRTKAKHVGKLLVAASKGKSLGSIADDDLVLKHTAGLRRADLFSRESRQALPSPTFAHSSARLYFGVWECK